MAGKTEVVVFNHGFEEGTSQDGSPTAANPELDSPRFDGAGAPDSVRAPCRTGLT